MKENVFLIGPMGAGKSTIGKYLAQELGMEFYDTDRIIEQKTGVSVSWIFDLEGEIGFKKREKCVLKELTEKTGIVLATGGNIVASEANRLLLSSRGRVIYLRLNVNVQLERTKEDSRRPQLNETDELLYTLQKLQKKFNPFYQDIADHVFDTSGFSPKSVAHSIKKVLIDS
ncbi:MAG: shikimate kinase AroK [Legionellales bacterium]|nr:shikimate kinase AroK [Legionellales bacterium]